MWLILLMYGLCASSFTLAKAVLAFAKPIFFVGIRMVAAGLLLMPAWFREKRSIKAMTQHEYWLFGAIIIFHVYLAYLCDLWSLQYMTSFKSSFFFNLAPFFTALIAWVILAENVSLKQWLGMVIGFLGCFPMLLKNAPTEQIFGELLSISVPEIILLCGVFSSSVGWICLKKLLAYGHSPIKINSIGMIYGGIAALGTSLVTEQWLAQAPVNGIWQFIVLTGAVIIVSNVFFYNMYGYLLHKYSATFLSFAGFICPLFTALFGYVFLSEQVTWHFYISSAIVSLGLYIFYQDELAKRKENKKGEVIKEGAL